MLLHIMSLARNIRRDDPTRGQPHPRRLALRRIRFLRLRDAHFQTDALETRRPSHAQRRRHGFAGPLRDPAALGLKKISGMALEGGEGRLRGRGLPLLLGCRLRGG